MQVTHTEMKKLPYIIAVDFDGTIVEDKYPEIGAPIEEMIEAIKYMRKSRSLDNREIKLILWTCRDGEQLQTAVDFCRVRLGIVFDAVNTNLDETKSMFDNDTRKVYANEYWDDKAPNLNLVKELFKPKFDFKV